MTSLKPMDTNKARTAKPSRIGIVTLTGVFAACVFWILEALVHRFFFIDGKLIDVLFFPNIHEIWTRSLVMGALIAFGVFGQATLNKRRLAEDARVESEEQFRMVVEQSFDGIYVRTLDGKTTLYNKAMEAITGHTVDEIDEFGWIDAVVENGAVATEFSEPESRGKVANRELPITRKNGESVWISSSTSLIEVEGRECVLGIVKDITDRKRAERSLWESEERYRQLVELSPCAIVVHNEGEIVFANPMAAKIVGASSTETLIGVNVLDIVHPDSRDLVTERIRILTTEMREVPLVEEKFVRFDGVAVDVVTAAIPITYNGKPSALAMFLDTTERKRTEGELLLTTAELEAIFRALPDLSFRFDSDNRIIDFHSGCAADLFAKPEEFLGKRMIEVLPPEEGRSLDEAITQARATMSMATVEYSLSLRDEEQFFEARILPLLETQAFAVVRNVTDRRRSEEALKESARKWHATFDAINDIVSLLNLEGKILQCNRAMSEFLGRPYDEIVGRFCWESVGSTSHCTKGCPLTRMLESRVRESSEIQVGDGWFGVTVDPVFDDTGELVGAVHAATDTTLQKEAQRMLQDGYTQLDRTMKDIIRTMASIVETRDPYTAGHEGRVAQLSCAIAEEMNLSDYEMNAIQLAATIHDIGKIYTPAEILARPGELNEVEFSLIKTHTQHGYDILSTIDFPWPIAEIVLQHHERMDGSGYPNGLAGEKILLEARIIAVADVVEAVSSHRPYRPALGTDAALDVISRGRGILFDERVVDTCLKLFDEKRFALDPQFVK